MVYSYDRRVAQLIQKYREETGQQEWALVGRKGPKVVLKWFGVERPSDKQVAKEEARVQFFKKKASVVLVEHAYGQWEDKTGRWALSRRLGDDGESFLAKDLRSGWCSTRDRSISQVVEALQERAKKPVVFLKERY